MRWQPLPIVGGAYQDDTRPWSSQDTVNLIPVVAEKQGTRTPAMLRCAPGFGVFSSAAQSAPCRGLHNVEGALYGVIGDKLYTWATNGDATSLGSIPGVERVSMAHNQIAGGNQLAIAANNSGYVYDTKAGTLTQITDDGFPGALYFTFIDQYIVGIDPSRNFAYNSALADATSYNTLDRVQAEAQPDKLTGLVATHDQLWLFGERTIQPCSKRQLTEEDSFAPFEADSNMMVEVGCASGHTIANMDNSLFWLGNDGIVHRADGYTPERISTHPVEQAISRCNRNGAFAFTFEDRGHKVYYLTFPDGETWGYDAASGEWHRRQSYGMDRWRIADLAYWNGKWIGGDYANGKLYALDWDVQYEAGAILDRRRVFGPVTDNENPIIVNGLRIVLNTGEKPTPPQVLQAGTTILGAQLSDWRYLQVTDDDDVDYSASDFDDSSWSTGTAPFGAWSDDTTGGLPAAHTFDSRFAAAFGTNWDTSSRLWLRRTLTLSAIPDDGIDITYYMDDHFTIYVNGESIFSSSDDNPDAGAGATFTVSDSKLVIGENSIAVICHDEEPAPEGVSVTYFDMYVVSK